LRFLLAHNVADISVIYRFCNSRIPSFVNLDDET
jgi:hypothetical protein